MSKAKTSLIGLLSLGLALFLAGSATAAPSEREIKSVIDRLSKGLVGDPEVPGISIAVLKKGASQPVQVAFGSACVENAVVMTPAKKFKLGSVTKVFTAALIHRLIEAGTLEYDTPIHRFFPQFPHGEAIKIRDLLNHTSGIADMLSLAAVNTNMTKRWTPAELIAMAGAEPLAFAPGTDQRYSNTGYLMLAVISEMVSGESYGEQIGHIFRQKLGMKTLSVGRDEAIVPQLSCGYSESAEQRLQQPIMASIAVAKGTGNLEAAPGDVVRLVNLDQVLKTDVFDTVALRPLTLANGRSAQFVRPAGNGKYTGSFLDGCTLFAFDDPAITLVGKLGSFPGFGTVFFYDRKTQLAVAISVNNEKSIVKAITLGARILAELRS